MGEAYRILYREGESEVVEKKSRFLGVACSVQSEQEVLTVLERIRKTHYNARHHCYAYVIGEQNQQIKSSDDGEPQGTAGKPILDLLVREGIHNALIVVTRYFGGTLLGTGGLVRAYGLAAKEALNQGVVLTRLLGEKITLSCDYTSFGKIQYKAQGEDISLLSSEFGAEVCTQWMAPEEKVEGFLKQITEITGGKAEVTRGERMEYALWQGELIYL